MLACSHLQLTVNDMNLATVPRMWPYEPSNSPLPLPPQPLVFTQDELHWIQSEQLDAEAMTCDELKSSVATWKTGSGTSIDAILEKEGVPLMADRRLILLLGELANPRRLADIGAGPLPIINVRIDDICRTWTDTLDPRMMNPGVHHVTVARTHGWWETTHLGFATMPQVRQLMEHLEDGSRGKWKPGKLAEGQLHVIHDATLSPPSVDDLVWDGETERVEIERPPFDGPALPIVEVFTPIHTRQGCYNHRGRLARCVHHLHRAFHNNIFRRGSARQWDDVVSVQKR